MIGETYTSPAGHAGVPWLMYCLVGAGISDAEFKVYKVRFKWPISISVSPVQSLDDGACHKHNLVGGGETIRQCIAWPLGQPACGIGPSGSLLVGSAPRFPACRPQGFPSDY